MVVDVLKGIGSVQDGQSATTDLTTTLGLPEGNFILVFKFVASCFIVVVAVATCTFGWETTNEQEEVEEGSALCSRSSTVQKLYVLTNRGTLELWVNRAVAT